MIDKAKWDAAIQNEHYRDSKAYIEATPRAKEFLDRAGNIGIVPLKVTNRVMYRINPRQTDQYGERWTADDVSSTDITATFSGDYFQLRRRLVEIFRSSPLSRIHGPFEEENGKKRTSLFEAPCENSGLHQTSVEIICEPD